MKTVVTYAKLHTTLFVPHFGNVEATIPPKGKTMVDLKMIGNDAGIELTFKGTKDGIGLHSYRCFVPWGTVQAAVLGDDIKEKQDDTAKAESPTEKAA